MDKLTRAAADGAEILGMDPVETLLSAETVEVVGFERLKQPETITTLYTVTTIARDLAHGGTRTPVICTSLERAKEIVETNEGDIFETSYRYVVIESLVADVLYPQGATEEYLQIWYEWSGSYKEGRYVPCDVPKKYKRVMGFGIG